MTLCELVPLLTEPSFRRFVVNQPGMPDVVRAYWQRYDAMSEGERQQTNMPLLHKVEAFTSRTPIRLMLGQSAGFDFADVFRQRKTVLISLAKGSLGTETANLLGSLLVMLLWQTTLARVAVPAAQRRPVFAYIDEAPDLMRLPIPLTDMVSQARGLGLGFVFAMQFIAQASQTIRAALLGTVRTQFSFAVEREDAVLLAQRFAPLTAEDLQGLEQFEAAFRACLGGVTAPRRYRSSYHLEDAVPSRVHTGRRSTCFYEQAALWHRPRGGGSGLAGSHPSQAGLLGDRSTPPATRHSMSRVGIAVVVGVGVTPYIGGRLPLVSSRSVPLTPGRLLFSPGGS
jgi:hypothetical protein